MEKKLFQTVLSLFFIISAGVLAQTSAQTISGSIGTLKRGGSTKATVVMNIPNGLHVNSNNPGSEYAIPTVLKVSASGAKVGSVMYPRGKSRKLAFSEETINVYEGRTVFTFNIAVPANFKGNAANARVVVRYQACTDEVCYPPKSKDITLSARVR